LILKHI